MSLIFVIIIAVVANSIVFVEITRTCLSSYGKMKKLPDVLKGCSLVTLAKSGLVYNATSECIMCYPYEDGLEVSQYSTSTRNLHVQ